MQRPSPRRLTDGEIHAVPTPIADTIDLFRVEIHRRRWTVLTPPRITVARGYKIFWPGAPEEAVSPAKTAHLVHEITHVWQYHYLGVGLYSLRWLDRRYTYTLKRGDRLISFGLEQQASIVEDYVLSELSRPLRRAQNNPSPALLRETVMGMTKS